MDNVKGWLTRNIVCLTRVLSKYGDTGGRAKPSVGEGSRPPKAGLNRKGPEARRPISSVWPWWSLVGVKEESSTSRNPVVAFVGPMSA